MLHAVRKIKRGLLELYWSKKRKSKIRRYFKDHEERKLLIGCGSNIIQGWLGSDYTPKNRDTIFLDATVTFPFSDKSFDYVCSEHMIEHITYNQALFMLNETYRILKVGGVVRIATPDLRQLFQLLNSNDDGGYRYYTDWYQSKYFSDSEIMTPVMLINHFMRSWGHSFVYDKLTLTLSMRRAGFHSISSYIPGSSDISCLAEVERHGQIIGEKVNAFETLVLQGIK